MSKREVLSDGGFVRLVDSMGSDLSVVRSARVSYNADWRTGEDEGKDEKLLRFLLKNKHTSPFESVIFTFEIKCPIFIARQWMRHRTWSYSELSGRYKELEEGFYVPEAGTVGFQSTDNKQAREITGEDTYHEKQISGELWFAMNAAFEVYEYLLKQGVPREIARSVLPLSTYTRFFATVDLHNLMHFIRLRIHSHSQYEVQLYAQALLEFMDEIVPVTAGIFREIEGISSDN